MGGKYGSELAKKSSVVFVGQIFDKLIAVIYGILVVRVLGAEIFGSFTSVFSFLSILSVIALIGFPFSLNKTLPQYTAEGKSDTARSIATFSYIFVVTVSLLLTILLLLLSKQISISIFSDTSIHKLVFVMSPLLILIGLDSIQVAVFNSYRKIRHVTISNYFIKPILKCVIIILYSLIYKEKNANVLVFTNYCLYSAGIIFLGIYASKFKLHSKIRLKYKAIYAYMLKFSAPLFFASLISVFMNNFDVLSIKYFFDSEQVGIYRVACNIAYMNTFFVTSIDAVFGPIISELHSRKAYEQIGYYYKLTTKACNLFSFIYLGLVVVLSRELLQIYGQEFIGASVVLILITVGQLMRSCVGSAVYLLSMSDLQRYILSSSIITIVVNVILNILLVPRLGINGAAIASMTSIILRNGIYLYHIKTKLNMWPYDKSYIKILGCFAFVTYIGWVLRNALNMNWIAVLILMSAAICISYLALYYHFVLNKKEKTFYTSLLENIKVRLKRSGIGA